MWITVPPKKRSVVGWANGLLIPTAIEIRLTGVVNECRRHCRIGSITMKKGDREWVDDVDEDEAA